MKIQGEIFVLTGDRDSGKTLTCQKVLGEMNGRSCKISGIVSPGRYENGRKTGIFCMDAATGEKKVLAIHSPGWDPDNPRREWLFDHNALVWGNERLGRSVPTDLLIIDEIGFLEFEKDEGWTNALTALDSGRYHYALIVVRPPLLENALDRYPQAEIIKLLSEEDQEEAVNQLVKRFSIAR